MADAAISSPPAANGTLSLALAVRLARRELRGGLKGFRIFLACLALGVAALAAIGSLSEAIVAGLKNDARAIVGGDVEVRLTSRGLSEEQVRYIGGSVGAMSTVREMRAMAFTPGANRTLVELKGVDGAYPLFGAISLDPPLSLAEALSEREGRHGAITEPGLLTRLKAGVGDTIRVGDMEFEVRASIVREPDRVASAFILGPRLMVSAAAFDATGLIRPGSLVRHKNRVQLAAGTSIGSWVEELRAAFPEESWSIRDVRDSQPGVKRFVDRFGVFLTLVGLTALVVGGIGVANAVKTYLEGRTATIAILKCLGSPGALIFRVYLVQVMALALVGIAVGVLVGALAPLAVATLYADALPFPTRLGIYPGALLLATVYGLLTTFAFAVWPLARAREVPAAGLFRAVVAPPGRWPRPKYVVAAGLAVLALAGLAIFGGNQAYYTKWFVLGTVAALLVLRLAALGLMRGVAALGRVRRPALRLALTSLSRPGAPTAGVLVSLGAGLSVLVTVALMQGNISREIAERVPEEAPAFFFIDIQPDQAKAFESAVKDMAGVREVQRLPMLRGRLIEVKGVPVKDVRAGPHSEWVTRSEIGFTYTSELPKGTRLTAGEWWPADYAGPPAVSLDAEVAEGLGVGVGDSLTFSILGRPMEVRVANLRIVDWGEFGINFVVLFAPGSLEGAPQSHVASARVEPSQEEAVYAAVTSRFANVSTVRVRQVIETLTGMLQRMATAVRAIAGLAILSGILVLAGAVAAGHRRRVYDAVILKVLGATRFDVLKAIVIEYAVIGGLAAAIAAVVGWVAAYVVVTEIMHASWTPLPGVLAVTTIGSLVVTVCVGLLGTWTALSQRPAPLLRVD